MKVLITVKSILYFIFCIVLFFIHENFVQNLRSFIPVVMIVYGVFEIVIGLMREKKKFLTHHAFYFGCIEFVIGCVMLFFITDYTEVCIIWALWSILRESLEIEEVVERMKEGIPAFISVIESVVIIVFSILLLIEPGEHHAHIHAYLLSLELFMTALTPFADMFIKKKIEKRKEKKLQTTSE